MCLIVQTLTPYTKSQIRWKIFNKEKDGTYTSCFQRDFVWPVNKKATTKKEYQSFVICGGSFRGGGFHVFVTRKDARKTLKTLKANAQSWNTYETWKNCIVKKVVVDDFICGGLTNNVGYSMDGLKSEAWEKLEILD